MPILKTRPQNHRLSGGRGGFVHVLLLILVVLGITMWGLSELLQRTVEQKQRTERKSDSDLEAARRALLDYALVYPDDMTESLSLPGRFNAYRAGGGGVPFRRFALPCPDVAFGADGDNKLDGVSDSLQASCAGDEVAPLASGSRFGRLPWRDFSGGGGATYEFVRGVGGRDFRDGYHQLFWYGLSGNVANPDAPLNPHALLRMTTGWLSVVDENANVISDRVVAIAISPGLHGGDDGARIEESLLFDGEMVSVTATVTSEIVSGGVTTTATMTMTNVVFDPTDAATFDDLHESYLSEGIYSGLSQGSIVVDFSATDVSADRVEYLTIEDLAADDGLGIDLLENNGDRNIYGLVGGEGDFLGVTDLLDSHLRRFGFLPDPAMFDDSAVNSRVRPAGAPAQSTVTVSYVAQAPVTTTMTSVGPPPVTTTMTTTVDVTIEATLPFQQGAKVDSPSAPTVVFRVNDLPPVYLAAGAGLSIEVDNVAIAPPYNIALADLHTGLNDIDQLPLAASMAISMAREEAVAEHYPESLFGVNNAAFGFGDGSTADPNPLLTVDNSLVVATVVVNTPFDITLRAGDLFPVVLADSAYAYFENSALVSLVSYSGADSSEDIAKLPPYAARVLLPAGTFLTLNTENITLRLPSDFRFYGAFDPQTRKWKLDRPSEEPVVISAPPDLLATVVGVPNGWIVEPGGMGILPMESVSATAIPSGATVAWVEGNAVSDLATEMVLYAESDLTITPFPPPGLPSSLGSARLPTPMMIPARTEFELPAGGRVLYPAADPLVPNSGSFKIGDGFAFPSNSIAQYPPGAMVGVMLPPNAVLPGGRELNNAATITMTVKLRHGGFMRMRSARPVLEGPAVVGARQKMFDIEFRGRADFSDGGVVAGTVMAGQALQPFTGRLMAPPPRMTLSDGAVLSSDSRARAKFMTHPRRIRVPGPGAMPEVYDAAADNAVTLSVVRLLLAPDDKAEISISVTVSFDEDSEFLLPPGFALTITRSDLALHPTHLAEPPKTVMVDVTLPPDTAIFEPEIVAALAEIREQGEVTLLNGNVLTTDLRAGAVLLAEELTLPLARAITVSGARRRGAAENRLVLLPESDMHVFSGAMVSGGLVTDPGNVSVIAAGGMVDLLEGVAHSPVGVQRFRRVADDLQIESDGAALMYFDQPATLRADFPKVAIDRDSAAVNWELVETPPLPVLQVPYVSYGAAGVATTATITVSVSLQIPANSHIVIPGGQHLDFLSSEAVALDQAQKDAPSPAEIKANYDYAHLPAQAALVIPPDATLTAETDMGPTMVVGPAYFGLGYSDRGFALVDHKTHLSGEPLVFLSRPAYLVDRTPQPRWQDAFYAPIPANARLDIRGGMEIRSDSGFYGDLMPIDSAEFFRDFPIMYAVAPECRKAVSLGAECAADANEGLIVSLEAGEEYVLTENLPAPAGGVLLSAKLSGLQLQLTSRKRGDAMLPGGSPIGGATFAWLHIDDRGVVTAPPLQNFARELNDELVIDVSGRHLGGENEIYAYLGVDSATGSIAGKHRVAIDGPLTLHVGGYLGDRYADAMGHIALAVGDFINLGAGAKLAGAAAGERIFGEESFISDTVVTITTGTILDAFGFPMIRTRTITSDINLADYVLAGDASSYHLSLTLSADAAQIGLRGGYYFRERANSPLNVVGLGPPALPLPADAGGSVAISVHPTAEIAMEPGYLWQGYIPAAGRTLSLAPAANANSHTIAIGETWPPASVYLRVQPTATALNFWGSGLETPDAIDGVAQINAPPLIFPVGHPLNMASDPVTVDAVKTTLMSGMTLTRSEQTTLIGSVTFDASLPADYDRGFLALLHGGADAISIRVRARDAAGGAATEQIAMWRPVAFSVGAGAVAETTTALRWNRKNNPAPGDIGGAFAGLADPPGEDFENIGISLTVSGGVTSTVEATATVTRSNEDAVWAGRLVNADPMLSEDAYIDGFMCAGEPARAVFNPPHFQMVANANAPVYVAWRIPDNGARAHVAGTVAALGVNPGAAFGDLMASHIERPPREMGYFIGDDGLLSLTTSLTTAIPIDATGALLTVNTDLVFYLDLAHNQLPGEGLAGRTLRFGDDFRLSGPGALVPPFGGANATAVADVYAERSKLMSGLFGYPALHAVYDQITGSCMTTNDCAALYENADWFPILGGVVAFDGVDVSLVGTVAMDDDLSLEPRLVLPQPQAEVMSADGEMVTIYAGSIIYPRRGLIYPSRQLPPGKYALYLPAEGAVAAVDVSPVFSPRPSRLYRDPAGAMHRGDFHYPPIRATTATGAECIIEPLGFAQEEIIDFSAAGQLTVFDGVAVAAAYTVDAPVAATAAATTGERVLRYDGSFARGFLLNDNGVAIITTYYSGGSLATLSLTIVADGAPPTTLTTDFYSSYVAEPFVTIAADAPGAVALPLHNTDVPLGNPLAFRWTSAPYGGLSEAVNPFILPFGSDPFPPSPSLFADGNLNNDLVGVFAKTGGDEFLPLRLAHRIELPPNGKLEFFGHEGGLRYPLAEDRFFQFPEGSAARVLNIDAATWLSAHPYLARYQQGLEISRAGVTLTVDFDANDGYANIDVGGRRLLHYHRSESSSGDEVFSAAPVFSNAWVRLPGGAVLIHEESGQAIELRENTLLNPIMGTYVFNQDSAAGSGRAADLENNYMTRAMATAEATLVRAALSFPAGSRLLVGSAGSAVIRNVKAAAIFSPAPLESVDCPIGALDILAGVGAAAPAVVDIDQLREGVDENAHLAATGRRIGFGHPCAWIDDPENMDGDRVYLYRGRRRYADENTKARSVSNDRTYLLGGKLEVTTT